VTHEEPVHRADPDREAAPDQPRLNFYEGHVSLLGNELADEAAMRLDLARMSVPIARLGHCLTVLQRTPSPADRTRYADPKAGRWTAQTAIDRCDPGPEDPVKVLVPSMLASCHQQEA
jgi:hypothetical protein